MTSSCLCPRININVWLDMSNTMLYFCLTCNFRQSSAYDLRSATSLDHGNSGKNTPSFRENTAISAAKHVSISSPLISSRRQSAAPWLAQVVHRCVSSLESCAPVIPVIGTDGYRGTRKGFYQTGRRLRAHSAQSGRTAAAGGWQTTVRNPQRMTLI